MRLIDADTFRHQMYHEVFEKDSEDQRWDSGCWMRYRLFDKILEEQPAVDAVEVVRCEHCLAYDSFKNGIEGFCRKMGKVMCGSDFCSYAERRTDE